MSEDSPLLTKTFIVPTIRMDKGQTLTVWMEGTQLEIRILPDGLKELYCDDPEVEVQRFILWVPMETAIRQREQADE